MKESAGERELRLMLQSDGLTGWEQEYRFHPVRRWRFDFAFPKQMVAVEVEGITYYGGRHKLGRHQTAKGIEADMEKYEEALRLGWTVYRCSQHMVSNGRALETIKILLEQREAK